MGTDYTGSSFRTRPPIDAIVAVKRGDPFKGLDQELVSAAAASLKGSSASFEVLLNPVQLAKFMDGAPAREPETLAKMAGEYGWPSSWIC